MKASLGKLSKMLSKNSPTILTGLSVAGLVGTVIFAVKATPKAMILCEEALEEKKPHPDQDGEVYFDDYLASKHLTKKEIFITCWKCYIPAAAMGAVTISCIIAANTIHLRRTAALASVYSLAEATLREYQEKVVETIGKNKEQKVRDDLDRERLEANPLARHDVIFTGKGDVLCYDKYSGRYFKSDIEKIRRAQNDLNEEMLKRCTNDISLNDVYYELGLPNIEMGDQLGWNLEYSQIKFLFSSQLTETSEPCLVVGFEFDPAPNF